MSELSGLGGLSLDSGPPFSSPSLWVIYSLSTLLNPVEPYPAIGHRRLLVSSPDDR